MTWTFGLGAIRSGSEHCCHLLPIRLRCCPASSRGNVHRRLVTAAWAPYRSAHCTALLMTRATPGWCAGGAPGRRCKCFCLAAEAGIGQRSARAIGPCSLHGIRLPGLRPQDIFAVFVLIVASSARRRRRPTATLPRRIRANRDRVCDIGLWAWSRHPNYFFEWLGWVAYPLFASILAVLYPWGWIAVAVPACMYWLLVYVSGIPLWKSTCWSAGTTHSVRIKREPALSFRRRRARYWSKQRNDASSQKVIGIGERCRFPDA